MELKYSSLGMSTFCINQCKSWVILTPSTGIGLILLCELLEIIVQYEERIIFILDTGYFQTNTCIHDADSKLVEHSAIFKASQKNVI